MSSLWEGHFVASRLQCKLQNYRQAEEGTDWVTAVGDMEHTEFPHVGERQIEESLWEELRWHLKNLNITPIP